MFERQGKCCGELSSLLEMHQNASSSVVLLFAETMVPDFVAKKFSHLYPRRSDGVHFRRACRFVSPFQRFSYM